MLRSGGKRRALKEETAESEAAKSPVEAEWWARAVGMHRQTEKSQKKESKKTSKGAG